MIFQAYFNASENVAKLDFTRWAIVNNKVFMFSNFAFINTVSSYLLNKVK
jgi:hypothetical protein